MNRMKKLASLLLALVMLFAMTATAFAYTITAPDNDHTYQVYQIFTGDLHEGVLSNVKWGQNGTGTQGTEVNGDILAGLEALQNATDAEKLDAIEQYANLETEPYGTVTAAASLEEVPAGYYLIKDIDNALNGDNDVYTTYIVQIVENVTIVPKGTVPTVDKVIVEGEKKVEENEVSIGDTITYEFTGTLPSNIADYNTYFYLFTDTMTAGLTYTNNLTVMVGDVDVTKYFYHGTEVVNGETVLTVGMQDLLALENLNDVEVNITADTKVVVTYTAVLNEDAVVGTTGNTNTVDLTFSNDPNHDDEGTTEPPQENPEKPEPENPTGTTPEDEVYTYTTELIINKVDENNNILTGAEFTITGESVNVVVVTREVYVEDVNGTFYKLADGTYTETAPNTSGDESDNSDAYADVATKYSLKPVVEVKENTENIGVKAYVDEKGVVKFTGLGAGEYTISESVTPAGYNTIKDFKVTITWDMAENDKNDCVWNYAWDGITGEGNTVTVVNQTGTELPETGGVGTTMLYVVGGLLVAGAVVVMISRKKAEEK